MNKRSFVTLALFGVATFCASAIRAEEIRSAKHQAFAEELWTYLNTVEPYGGWKQSKGRMELPVGPPTGEHDRFYLNPLVADGSVQPRGAIIVAEHFDAVDGEKIAVSVWYKMNKGYHAKYDDWYFAHYTPDGSVLKTSADTAAHGKRGFVTIPEDGRLWVFATASPELAEFKAKGELAKHVIRPGAGPEGMTLKSADSETIERYLKPTAGDSLEKPGFVTKVEDGRLWVFHEGSPELAEFEKAGELAKHVIRPGAGPNGMTVKAPDGETIDAYLGK